MPNTPNTPAPKRAMLTISPMAEVPLTAYEVLDNVQMGLCPMSMGIHGVCKHGVRDMGENPWDAPKPHPSAIGLAHTWRIAWAFLVTGDFAVEGTDEQWFYAQRLLGLHEEMYPGASGTSADGIA